MARCRSAVLHVRPNFLRIRSILLVIASLSLFLSLYLSGVVIGLSRRIPTCSTACLRVLLQFTFTTAIALCRADSRNILWQDDETVRGMLPTQIGSGGERMASESRGM